MSATGISRSPAVLRNKQAQLIPWSRQIVEGLQALVKEHGLEDKVEMGGRFCMGDCQNGVCLTVDDQKFSLKPEDVQTFFEKEILPKV